MKNPVIIEAEEKFNKSIEVFINETKGIRTGRATPAIFENIYIEYYGKNTPLKQLATFAIPDARTVIIKPYDNSIAGEIERAILKSNLGLNPSNEGNVIRILIPPLSEERRKQYTKIAKEYAEKAKIAIRNTRRDLIKELETQKKDKKITEDEKKRIENELQKLLSDYEKKIDDILTKKNKEILES
ncbi:MAG: ribosome recycling factor [Planctomycetota bacterium]